MLGKDGRAGRIVANRRAVDKSSSCSVDVIQMLSSVLESIASD
jgi:hypothetical protein